MWCDAEYDVSMMPVFQAVLVLVMRNMLTYIFLCNLLVYPDKATPLLKYHPETDHPPLDSIKQRNTHRHGAQGGATGIAMAISHICPLHPTPTVVCLTPPGSTSLPPPRCHVLDHLSVLPAHALRYGQALNFRRESSEMVDLGY
jgi:hypothetical protein